jgi:peptide/nickel transport system permease protein
MSIGKYLLKRLLHAIPLLIGTVTVIFVLTRMAPGDPVDYLIGDATVSQEFVDRLRADMGLDQPLYQQLAIYIGKVATGDLGHSFVNRAPVLDLVLERFPATLLLMGSEYVLPIVIGVMLGVISAYRPSSGVDNAITVFSLASFAIPVFWLGQMLILVFAYYLDWFPIQGMINLREGYTGFAHVLDVAHHLVLPAFTLALYNPGGIAIAMAAGVGLQRMYVGAHWLSDVTASILIAKVVAERVIVLSTEKTLSIHVDAWDAETAAVGLTLRF